VEKLLAQLLSGTHGAAAYGLVFTILVLCGVGLPLPEDVSLILGGYLAYSKAVELPWMALVGLLGVLVGDCLIFNVGRRTGRKLNPDSWIGKHVTQEKLAQVEDLFKKYGDKIVMVARFAPGVRAPTYFVAGASGMPFWRFILFDGLAACVSAPMFVVLGKHFGGEITHLIHVAHRAQGVVFGTVAVLGGVYFLIQRRKKARLATGLGAVLPVAPTPTPVPAPTPEEKRVQIE
jgi:membrane protein DedA with SNARE-associated domain